MGALRSIAYATAAIVGVACSTAPFAPADPVDGGDDATVSGMDGTAFDAMPGADGDGAVDHASDVSSDADAAAADAAPPCVPPKQPNAGTCTVSSECCSNACASNNTCKPTCKSVTMACWIGGSDCCVGSYCSLNGFGVCALCRPTGAAAEVFGNAVQPASCCSGRVDGQGKCAL